MPVLQATYCSLSLIGTVIEIGARDWMGDGPEWVATEERCIVGIVAVPGFSGRRIESRHE
jgi:hypothetical protein